MGIFILVFFVYGYGVTIENLPIKMEKIAASKYPDDLIIGTIKQVIIDSKGNMFVSAISGQDVFIVKFDPDMNYIKRFASSGKGPGEVSRYINISTDENGNIYISDANPSRIMIYDNNGNYTKKEFYLDRMGLASSRNCIYIGNNNYTAYSFVMKTRSSIGIIFSLNENPIKPKDIYNYEEKQILITSSSFFGNLASTNLYGGQDTLDSNFGHFIYANSQEFRFIVYDSKGDIVCKVEDPKRMKNNFSDDEMEMLSEKSFKSEQGKQLFKEFKNEIRTSKHIINQVRISNDRVYVFTLNDIRVTDHVPVEIYDFKGKLIKKGTMPDYPRKIWKNYAYFVEIDTEDTPKIVKYKILE